jgi:hypothetical protein
MATHSRKQRHGAKTQTGRRSKSSAGHKPTRKSAQKAKRKPASRRNSRKAVQNNPAAPQKPTQYELAQKALRMAMQAHENSGSPIIARHDTPHSPSSALSERAPSSIPENPREQGDTANILQNTTNRRPGS